MICFHCKKEVKIEGTVGRREECPHCRSDLHVCMNCSFYDRGSYNECREPQADRVQEKERANFCDYFQAAQKGNSVEDQKAKQRALAESLFKKK